MHILNALLTGLVLVGAVPANPNLNVVIIDDSSPLDTAVSQRTLEVHVGRTGRSFDPVQVTANIGDEVKFIFHSGNHSVSQSSLDSPCTEGRGFRTGLKQFNAGDESNVYVLFTVQSLNPEYFFCSQERPTPHCQAGMVFAINPGDTMTKFIGNTVNSYESSNLNSNCTWSATNSTDQLSVAQSAPTRWDGKSTSGFLNSSTPSTSIAVSTTPIVRVATSTSFSNGDRPSANSFPRSTTSRTSTGSEDAGASTFSDQISRLQSSSITDAAAVTVSTTTTITPSSALLDTITTSSSLPVTDATATNTSPGITQAATITSTIITPQTNSSVLWFNVSRSDVTGDTGSNRSILVGDTARISSLLANVGSIAASIATDITTVQSNTLASSTSTGQSVKAATGAGLPMRVVPALEDTQTSGAAKISRSLDVLVLLGTLAMLTVHLA